MKIIVEAKFLRAGDRIQKVIDEISSDASLYSAMGNDCAGIVPVIWNDSARSHEHDYLRQGLRKLPNIIDAVRAVSRGSCNCLLTGWEQAKSKLTNLNLNWPVPRLLAGESSSELWIAAIDSGRSEPLLPGLATLGSTAYDISPDGLQVVVASADRDGKPRLWLASLDRRSPPRQIPNGEGEQPVFGADGEVFFRRVEGSSGFLYRVREDGTGLRRAVDPPILDMVGISPDRRWLTMWPPSAAEDGSALMFRIDGGAPFPVRLPPPVFNDGVSRPPASVQWPADGKHIFVEGGDKTYVVPLPPSPPAGWSGHSKTCSEWHRV
jgi:hypothetical protein